MKKDNKNAISLIFHGEEGKVLIVKRSDAKESFPGFWSLPSTYIHDDESPLEAANRLAQRKLGIDSVSLGRSIGSNKRDKGDLVLTMEDFEVASFTGELKLDPDEYTDLKWLTKDGLRKLLEVEHDGKMGQCCEVFLASP
ncbi:NUDIX hydrolase [Candidatus Uhrbacteria bacterium]|nr:NUDIX hydrolase [Candidatus Uhrbacteria bacterium]